MTYTKLTFYFEFSTSIHSENRKWFNNKKVISVLREYTRIVFITLIFLETWCILKNRIKVIMLLVLLCYVRYRQKTPKEGNRVELCRGSKPN